ncbi:MAG: VanZ family protein [Candidatus Thiodiazotropha endolucinida]
MLNSVLNRMELLRVPLFSFKDSWFVFLALLLTTAILLGTNLPGDNRLMYSLQDSGHFLIFSLLTLIALWPYRRVRDRSIWPVLVLVLIFGLLIEGAQYLIGRDPSLYDVILDLLGIAAGGIIYTGFIRRSLAPHLSIAILLLLVLSAFAQPLYWYIAYQVRADQFPRLIDPDDYFSRALIEGSEGGVVRHVDLPGDWSLPADLDIDSCAYVTLLDGRWPGVDMQEPESDWRGYERLELLIYSDQSENLPLTLRIHDQNHNRRLEDRYNLSLVIQPGYNHFSLPLHEVEDAPSGRTMDMAAISDVMIFATRNHIGRGFCLLSMGLQ